jgi:uncharacterized protein YecE (DUF72 family)
MARSRPFFIGTAGWSIPRGSALECPGDGTHLERYARRLSAAEINSSFYRPHAAAVYVKWAAATPPAFRFAVKLPKVITHDQRLTRARAPLERFLDETSGLGAKRGPILIQLPPSFAFEARTVGRFLALLRSRHDGPVVCEPRHASWASDAAGALLSQHRVARVGADPAPFPAAASPGGWPGLVYFRLHGSPRTYWSRYDGERLATWAETLARLPADVEAWCLFDNTASGAALPNALDLDGRLHDASRSAEGVKDETSTPSIGRMVAVAGRPGVRGRPAGGR